MKFEVPHRQQIASDPDSALFVRSGPFHHFLRPVNAELVSGEPFPYPGVDRPLRGNCHPLFCAPDNQVRCVFGSAPYQKQASTVRNTHSVLKKASCVRDAFSEAFGVKNRLLRYGRDIWYRKRPSLVRDASSKARRTSPATSNTFSKARRTACNSLPQFLGYRQLRNRITIQHHLVNRRTGNFRA